MIRWLMVAALAVTPVSAPVMAGAQSADSIEARLGRVEDALAIERILVDYAALLDGRDYAGYAALFTPDGEWANAAVSNKGRDAIRAMLEKMLGPAGAPNRSNYHIVSNPRIALDGDRATATSRYLFVMRGADGRPVASLAGIYRDELVRLDGNWMIRRRVADDIMPTPEEWRKIMQGTK
ncbi:MAG: nuclear transport factor 2 family protein [Sphingomonas sp.]